MWVCFRPHILHSTRLCADTKFMDTNVQRNIRTSFKANGSKVLSGHNSTSLVFFVELAVIQAFHTIASAKEVVSKFLTGPSAAQLTVTLCTDLN